MTLSPPNGAIKRKRLLTGLRPTGKFHLGNYVGTFEKDLELQNSGDYECFFFVADYHALTTGFETSNEIGDDIREGVLDFWPSASTRTRARCTSSRSSPKSPSCSCYSPCWSACREHNASRR